LGFRFPVYDTVIMGDLHGRPDVLLQALNDLGLVGEDGRWSGGRRRFIQAGDVCDRGPEGLVLMDLLMRLQEEVQAAGGEVVCLLGNHDLYPVQAAGGIHQARSNWHCNGGGAAFNEWLGRMGRSDAGAEVAYPEAPYAEEFYGEFAADRPYGQWLRAHAIACRAGEYVVVHGGWPPGGPESVEAANAAWAGAPVDTKALAAALAPGGSLAEAYELLWARYQPAADVEAACLRLGCRGLIVGHTPVSGITSSCGGRLIQIDTGMYRTGVWTALALDEAGRPWALVQGQEPVLLEGDGVVPLPPAVSEGSSEAAAPPLYGPGSVVRMYRSADGAWRQYLAVEQVVQDRGYAWYVGIWHTLERGEWQTRAGRYPASKVDELGRAAEAGEVPGA
jgi:hypothetical protein